MVMEGLSGYMSLGHPNLTLFSSQRSTGVGGGNTGAQFTEAFQARELVDSQVHLKTGPWHHVQIEDIRYPAAEA